MVFQTRLDKFTVVSVWNYDILFIVLYLNSKPIFDTSSFLLLLLTRSLLSKKAKDMLLRQQNHLIKFCISKKITGKSICF